MHQSISFSTPARVLRLNVAVLCVSTILSGAILCSPNEAAGNGITILPTEIQLNQKTKSQRFIVYQTTETGGIGRALRASEYTVDLSNHQIASLEGQNLTALAGGSGEIHISSNTGEKVSAKVVVSNTDAQPEWSFRHDIENILTKLGCNSGACHGALAGKGGFRLSLRGYDPDFDHQSITRDSSGRRIEYAAPSKSLILTKPSGALPHKGGMKLNTDSEEYRVLADWISNGAKGPITEEPNLTRISVQPESSILEVGDSTALLVTAHYEDGTTRDVTNWAKFTSTDETIANVTETGDAAITGSGQGAVLVWFGSKVVLANLTVPYSNQLSDDTFANAPRKNFIDDINLKQLQELRLPPSPRCDDATFLRRATIDTIGRLPTTAEREGYFATPAKDRRDWLIDQLLAGDAYVDYWTYKWSDLLLINGSKLRPVAVKTYYQWVRDAVQQRLPWDQFVHQILTATGGSNENGATNFYALHQSPEEMTENASQAFLGLSIGCAKCHNHPLEKWTNDQYYAMANLFARVRAKGWGGDGRNGDGIRTVFVSTSGELIQPNRGKAQPPAPLDAPALAFDDTRDRRETLSNWMTDPTNPYFARAITNRIWSNFFGRGLVEQVDDLRLSNPASNEELLKTAGEYLVSVEFKLPELMRQILQSETYQRTSVAIDGNSQEQRYHSRYYPRRMMAEVLLDSIDQTLGTTTSFNEIAFPGADSQKTEFYAEGTRAIQLYDAAVKSYFLKTFGRNPREITCECERSDDPSMIQVLHLSNGETLNPKLVTDTNVISKMMEDNASNREIIDHLFITGLSRSPSDQERQNLLEIVSEYGDDRKTALADVAWSILTSGEFTFNH